MTNIISLHSPKPADDISETLRRIADDLDLGKYEFPVTTAVLLLGHTDSEVPVGDGIMSQQTYWKTYGLGPRCDTFTVRGLIATCMTQWEND